MVSTAKAAALNVASQATDAIKQMIGESVSAYADYEQLIGGVDTLFKDSSGIVMENASKAFESAGMSANHYMELSTSFAASLISGLAGDTEKAAYYADLAIKDMSDNANKFGTNIENVENAYRGFAKGNYTMLDNLSLGFAGTKEGMLDLVNASGIFGYTVEDLDTISFPQMIEAIHAIQDQMGVTGTTAKEAAETISGSKSAMEAAWENALTYAAGGDDAMFQDKLEKFKASFQQYISNIAPVVVEAIGGAGSIITTVVDSITSIPGSDSILAEGAENLIGTSADVIDAVGDLATWLVESITDVFSDPSVTVDGANDLGKSLGNFIGRAITSIVTNAPELVGDLFEAGVNLARGIVDGLFSGLLGTDETVEAETAQVIKGMEDAQKTAAKSNAIIDYMEKLIQTRDNATDTTEWKTAKEELAKLLPESGAIIDAYADNNIGGLTEALHTAVEEQRLLAIESAKNTVLEKKRTEHAQTLTSMIEADALVEMQRNDALQGRQQMLDFIDSYAGLVFDPDTGVKSRDTWEVDENSSAFDLADAVKGLLTALDSEEIDIGDDKYNEMLALANKAYESSEELQQLEEKSRELHTQYAEEEQHLSALEEAIDNVIIPLQGVVTEANNAARALSSVAGMGYGAKPRGVGEFATGLDTVPYDDFPAYLHRGEAVLTAAEASDWRRGRTASSPFDYNAFADVMMDAMSRMSISMNPDYIGAKTAGAVSRQIARELR